MQPEDYREAMPRAWQEGYRAAMNDAASVARELYMNHVHHMGADGLIARCLKAEQVFITDAEKMLCLLRHNGPVQAARSARVEPEVGQGGSE